MPLWNECSLEGDEEVITAFAIEMVEPLADDASEGLCFLPDLCFAMGSATLKVFQEMHDWQPAAPDARPPRGGHLSGGSPS
jgi:hypothetical protein